MARGYMGKVLRIDLTHGTLRDEPLSEDLCRKYIGGFGIGARILYDEMRPGIDPLGASNLLGFFTGPLTGTPCIQGNRFQVVCKSPLTGTWGDSNCGGRFGPYLKFAGYDAVLFAGTADSPVYLYIDNGKAELRDAGHLWGRDTNETEELIRNELGGSGNIQIASIGPAGERLSLIAGIIHDCGRAAGRSGVGAVMGSKRLKAIAVSGSLKIPMADEVRARRLRKEYVKRTGGDYEFFRTTGTIGTLGVNVRNGDAPIKNWGGVAEVDFPAGGDKFHAAKVMGYQTRKYGCWQCTVACGGHMEVKEAGLYQGTKHHKVEYETGAAFGTMTLNDDFPSLIRANELCNRYGFDTISAGATVAFAIECFENGLLALADTDGLELTWGNHVAMMALLDKMARREGIGDLLADGVARAAERIGPAAEKYAIHVHGQEVPMHDPKYLPALAATYKIDATPARHTPGSACWFPPGLAVPAGFDPHDYASQGELHKWMACMFNTVQAAGVCRFGFTSYHYRLVPDFLTVVTGWDFDEGECIVAGERIAVLRHAFNLREGLNPLDFKVPDRVLGIPAHQAGPLKGITVDVDTLVRGFLRAMDWDPVTARPSPSKLRALGLDDVLRDLYEVQATL